MATKSKKNVNEIDLSEKKFKKLLKENDKEAVRILKDENKISFLMSQFDSIKKSGFSKDVLYYLELMMALVKSYYRKEYREIPLGAIATIISALLYVINPFDLIPDVIPGIGYLDDAGLIIMVGFKFVKADLDKYAEWLEENPKLDPRKKAAKKTTKKKTASVKKTAKKTTSSGKTTKKATSTEKTTKKAGSSRKTTKKPTTKKSTVKNTEKSMAKRKVEKAVAKKKTK